MGRLSTGASLLSALLSITASSSLPDCDSSSSPKASIDESTSSFVISNGYVCIKASPGSISYAAADHSGNGNYGGNIFTNDGLTIEREGSDGSVFTSADLSASDVITSIQTATDDYVEVSMLNVRDSASSEATVSENWYLKLDKGARGFTFKRSGSFVNSYDVDMRAVRRMWSFQPTSLYGWYEDLEDVTQQSIVQMKNADTGNNFFPSKDFHMLRFYALGGSGDEEKQVGNNAIDIKFPPYGNDVIPSELKVLLSSSSGNPYWSGLQEVIFGGDNNVDSWYDNWGNGWDNTASSTLIANSSKLGWSDNITVYVNDLDYPAGALSQLALSPDGMLLDNLNSDDDLHSFLMGIYASPAGALCTHKNMVGDGVAVGQIATTIARPDYGYSGTYNYFDPDNYISTSALLWSGDSFLQEQVRMVLERSGSYLTEDGQLPHHFQGLEPQYEALSGEIQTGPNTFWILSCFNYAKSSGNFDWLRNYMPTLRLASQFLFNNIDDEIKLTNVPGSLMIDVFLRSNFTSDTNAMLVGFFREFAQAEAFMGNASGSFQLLTLAESMSVAMNQYLWCTNTSGLCDSFLYPSTTSISGGDQNGEDVAEPATSGDHFVTQWDGYETPTPFHDFMDYDANLMACAHGIPNDNVSPVNMYDSNKKGKKKETDYFPNVKDDGGARAKRILARIDAGQCRPSATFVSERYYGPDDTTGGNTGDSWCAMGRIAWFDALSRKRYNDSESFTEKILQPLQSQLLSTTWMHERVACDGSQQLNRTAMYFEYPSMVAMLLYRVKYGIELTLGVNGSTHFNFEPFTTSSFSYHINNMDVEYDYESFSLNIVRHSTTSSNSFSNTTISHSDIRSDRNGMNLDNMCYLHLSPMKPNTEFTVSSGSSSSSFQAISNELGELDFHIPVVDGVVQVTAVASS